MVFEKKYANGLRLVVKKMEGLMSVTMGILVGTGASAETDAEDGISHFIEHMLFKGTEKRTAYDISLQSEIMGGYLNAFTSRDCTCIYTKTLPEFLSESVELMLRVLATAIVTHVCAAVCRDSGEGTIGSYVEIGGKVEIVLLTLPMIKKIIDLAVGMI